MDAFEESRTGTYAWLGSSEALQQWVLENAPLAFPYIVGTAYGDETLVLAGVKLHSAKKGWVSPACAMGEMGIGRTVAVRMEEFKA